MPSSATSFIGHAKVSRAPPASGSSPMVIAGQSRAWSACRNRKPGLQRRRCSGRMAPMTRNESAQAKGSVEVEIRAVCEQDRPDWRSLFFGYGQFYDQWIGEEVLDRVWRLLLDEDHPTNGLVAVKNGQIVGFVHFRPYFRTLTGSSACFLDDLFVAPAERGRGVGRSLIEAISVLAEKAGWDFVRWMTAQDNRQARQLYDSVADKTEWLTYQLFPQTGSKE